MEDDWIVSTGGKKKEMIETQGRGRSGKGKKKLDGSEEVGLPNGA